MRVIQSYHLTFFLLINLLLLDLRACEMHFLLTLGLGNLSWLKVNTKVKDRIKTQGIAWQVKEQEHERYIS